MKKVLLATIITASSFLAMPLKSHGMTFNFKFTNDGDFFPGTEIPFDLPTSDVVGIGTFSFDEEMMPYDDMDSEVSSDETSSLDFMSMGYGEGIIPLGLIMSELNGQFNFNFAGNTFSNEDLSFAPDASAYIFMTEGGEKEIEFIPGLGGFPDLSTPFIPLVSFNNPDNPNETNLDIGVLLGESCIECLDEPLSIGAEPIFGENLGVFATNNFSGSYVGVTRVSTVPESSNNLSLLLLGTLGFTTVLVRRRK